MAGLIKDIAAHRDLLSMLVARNIKIRYKESALGFLWTLLGPVFLILIYAFFMKVVMKFPIPMPVLVSGIFVWQYLAMCLGDSSFAIIGNANLVKKACFPRLLLPLSIVLANFVNFLLSLLVMAVYLLIVGPHFGSIAWLPLALITHLALCTGVSLGLCAMNVFLRDVQHLTGIFTMAWFFLTPVVYALSDVAPFIQKYPLLGPLYFMNPMAGILALYRTALLGSPLPELSLISLSMLVSVIIFVAGLAIFQKLQPRFADEL
jgi:lipopolysaccharide transport system permease protein